MNVTGFAFSHSISASVNADFSWSWWSASYAWEFRMVTKLRLIRSDYCSCRYFEILAMRCSTAFHGDDHSVESAMTPMLGCLEYSVVFQASYRKRDALKSDGWPSRRTQDALRSRTRKEFYYHTNKICRQHKTCKE